LLEISSPPTISGGFVHLVPNASVNAVHLFTTYVGNTSDSISTTTTFAWSYYPRYLYVRPAST
jgi:hypothetical protein